MIRQILERFQKDAKDGFYVNSERLIFSLQKNRLQGLGDPIRGDLPIIPCNPNSNPNSNVWFRPGRSTTIDVKWRSL